MWMLLARIRDAIRRLFTPAPRCEYPGCSTKDVVECWNDDPGKIDGYFCPEHASLSGYCWGCGGFWAGVEVFDFSRDGLCENCRGDLEADSESDLYGDM